MKIKTKTNGEIDVKIKTAESLFKIKKLERDYKFKLEIPQTKTMQRFIESSPDITMEYIEKMQKLAQEQSKGGTISKEQEYESLKFSSKFAAVQEELFNDTFDSFWLNGEYVVNEALQAITQSNIDFWNETTYQTQKEIIAAFLFGTVGGSIES